MNRQIRNDQHRAVNPNRCYCGWKSTGDHPLASHLSLYAEWAAADVARAARNAEDRALKLRIYAEGGLMTVEREDELIRGHLYIDDEGDLMLRHCGAVTNIYGGTIADDGWQIVEYVQPR